MNIMDRLQQTGLTVTATPTIGKTIRLQEESNSLINAVDTNDVVSWDLRSRYSHTEYTPLKEISASLYEFTKKTFIHSLDTESLADLKTFNPIGALLLANELIKAGALDTSTRIRIFLDRKRRDDECSWISISRGWNIYCKDDETRLHVGASYQDLSGFEAEAGEKILL